MSPEQRADRFMSWLDRYDRGIAQNSIHQTVARAIRAAENAALERAAKHIMDIYPNCLAVAESVRSLKSRAPKRKAGRA